MNDIKVYEDKIHYDTRGHVTEVYGRDTNPFNIRQVNSSFSKYGTFRGIHYQQDPQQGRLVWVPYGQIILFCVDLRRGSDTFCNTKSFTLSDNMYQKIYAPGGFGWGFFVESNCAIVEYLCDEQYASQVRINYKSPEFDITLPFEPLWISNEDLSARMFNDYIAKDLI